MSLKKILSEMFDVMSYWHYVIKLPKYYIDPIVKGKGEEEGDKGLIAIIVGTLGALFLGSLWKKSRGG